MQHEPVTTQNARQRSEEYILNIPPYPGHFEGRGIVICAGGLRYFTSAWVCIHVLRQVGCTLPIQMWHLGPNEMDERMKGLVGPLNVTCVDAHEIRKIFPARILNGWEVKPFAIIHCPFQEVLLLDADNMPLVNPEFLFVTPQFEEHGAIFWPDLGRLNSRRMIWDLCGVAYRDEPEFESGQVVLDKRRCWEALALTMYYNEHSDFYYRHVHGDKETFHMAFRKLDKSYAMPGRGMDHQGRSLFQHDFEGNRLFQHQHKWSLGDALGVVPGIVFQEECLAYMQQLRKVWNGQIGPNNRGGSAHKTEAEKRMEELLTETVFIYHRVGFDKRPMTFLPDNSIGRGVDRCEIFWNVYEQDDQIILEIRSDSALTCALRQDSDGIWQGRWIQFERMAIELIPCSPSDSAERLQEAG